MKGWGSLWFAVVTWVGSGCIVRGVRYPDSGGLSPVARLGRELVRLQAAGLFAEGVSSVEIAGRLRVTAKSVRAWRRAWSEGGVDALASKGPGGAVCRLDPGQLDLLRARLDDGPAASGWRDDQRWTLARVSELIYELFRVRYTLRGVSYLLHRIGYSPQVPAHRAMGRDEQAIADWREETWTRVKARPQISAPGSCSPTKPASR